MEYLTTLDYILIGLVLVGGIWGAIVGFIREVAKKLGYVVGFATALMFTSQLVPFLIDKLNLPEWLSAMICYVVLFMVGFSVIAMLGTALKTIFDTAKLNGLDNLLGFLLGLAETIVLIGLISVILLHQNLFDLKQYFDGSYIMRTFIMPIFNTVADSVEGLL